MIIKSSFFVGVASSVTATVVTSIVWALWLKFKGFDPLRSLLGIDKRLHLSIIYGSVFRELSEPPQQDNRKKYATFEIGDIESAMIVYDRFKHLSNMDIEHRVGLEKRLPNRRNILSISGPKWNKASELLIGKIGSPLYFRPGVDGLIEKRKAHSVENVHKMEMTDNSDNSITIKTYGFIVCARSSYVNGAPAAILIAGLTTYGSLISSKYLSGLSRQDIRKLKKRLCHEKRFGLVIEGSIKINSNGGIEDIQNIDLISWIPENDFLDPYEYEYL